MKGRIIKKIDRWTGMMPYTLDGPEYASSANWLPITFNENTKEGSYYYEMLPGAVTKPHIHQAFEEFLIMEGEAIEDDGRVLRTGDFVAYPPGSYHYTRTETGCVMLVFEWLPKGRPHDGAGTD